MQANAYLTPATAQGFAVHHDTHDVFVLQVAGRKRWRVYEPVFELPLKDQRWSPELGDPGPPRDEFTLEAGDTLYLPRGWPHEAFAADEESLHLTVGLHPLTRMDAMRMRARRVRRRPRVPPLAGAGRRACPPTCSTGSQSGSTRASDEPRSAALRGRPAPDHAGPARPGGRLDELDPATPLRRRPTVIATSSTLPDGVTLMFEGKELRFPAKAATAVEAATELEEPFSADGAARPARRRGAWCWSAADPGGVPAGALVSFPPVGGAASSRGL